MALEISLNTVDSFLMAVKLLPTSFSTVNSVPSYNAKPQKPSFDRFHSKIFELVLANVFKTKLSKNTLLHKKRKTTMCLS